MLASAATNAAVDSFVTRLTNDSIPNPLRVEATDPGFVDILRRVPHCEVSSSGVILPHATVHHFEKLVDGSMWRYLFADLCTYVSVSTSMVVNVLFVNSGCFEARTIAAIAQYLVDEYNCTLNVLHYACADSTRATKGVSGDCPIDEIQRYWDCPGVISAMRECGQFLLGAKIDGYINANDEHLFSFMAISNFVFSFHGSVS